MEDNYKEVYFHLYCPNCKHTDADAWDDPCDECLNNPSNIDSHKPINYDGPEIIKKVRREKNNER